MSNSVLISHKRIRTEPLTFCIRERGEIRVHRSVIRALDTPLHMHFWWSEGEKVLLLSAAKEATPVSVSIPDSCRCRKNGVRFTNRELLRVIYSLAGWESKTAHRLLGEFVPELSMVAFRLYPGITGGKCDG